MGCCNDREAEGELVPLRDLAKLKLEDAEKKPKTNTTELFEKYKKTNTYEIEGSSQEEIFASILANQMAFTFVNFI